MPHKCMATEVESVMTTMDQRVANVAPYIAGLIAIIVTLLTFTTYYH